ncbi:class II fructose-bisphosphate aldolase [Deinococcus koreensis]|uniref:Ketose-bisphosphate aldolase n=1 Tax=Deinococcus koreensis TaxID=2054903 RepID=A0A2K3UT35_9DEIO|nr:class II fructose-bisphosphate aldolase [Deinococcus koreensis]PNY79703.1 ketose-bisphosphate aldolase [Deinococcus koreensis]
MPLVTSLDILPQAHAGGYAVGAFNCVNIEFARAVVGAAEELGQPVIVALTAGAANYAGWDALPAAVLGMAREARVPVCLHLDHGTSLAEVERALQAGFSSVMIDASALPLEENIRLTRAAAELAHAAGVGLEGELGRIGGKEDGIEAQSRLTDPQDVGRFVEESGVDFLAAAFGSVHQMAAREAVLDLGLVAQVDALAGRPLVLHGGSGVPFETVRGVIERGVAKVNIGTELQRCFCAALRQTLASRPDESDARKLLRPSIAAVQALVRERIALFSGAARGVPAASGSPA